MVEVYFGHFTRKCCKRGLWRALLHTFAMLKVKTAKFKRARKPDVDVAAGTTTQKNHPKRCQTRVRAWLVQGKCDSREDICRIDLEMRDPLRQLKEAYFDEHTTLHRYIMYNKRKNPSKQHLVVCYDEKGKEQQMPENRIMQAIFREIWPIEALNPFRSGLYGNCILYYTDLETETACYNMEHVKAVDALIDTLRVTK